MPLVKSHIEFDDDGFGHPSEANVSVLKSINGYEEYGVHRFKNSLETVEIWNDGKRKKWSITVDEVRKAVFHSIGDHAGLPYSNLLGFSGIINPECCEHLASIYLDGFGNVSMFGDKAITHEFDASSYKFVLPNDFIIGVHNYKLDRTIDADFVVSFRLFGERESFLSSTATIFFMLAIAIYYYDSERVIGEVSVCKADDFSFGTGYKSLGMFELTKKGTIYKGVETNVVYNNARYIKELVLQ